MRPDIYSRALRTALGAGCLLVVCVAPAALAANDLASAPTASVSPQTGGPYIGVWTSGPTNAEAAAIDDLKVGWARVNVVWSTIEPTPGTFNWIALDQSMTLASGNGRRTVLALVRNNPTWAATSRCMLVTDAERQALAGFLGVLAGRYKGLVWQFYNEEDNTSPAADAQYDLGGCFGTLGPDGTPGADGRARYASTLEAASAALRSVDPSAQLASGGVASGNFTDAPGGNFDKAFLPGVLAQLKQDSSLDSLDYVSVHYYSSQSSTYAAAGSDLLGRIAQLRQDLLAAGLTTTDLKPVISDELSYTDSIGTSTSDQNNAFNVAQRAYVPKLLARSAAAQLRAAFWFWLQDGVAGLGSDNAYGLKDTAGRPKPAYAAVRYFTSLILRQDQFLGAVDLSGVSANLEGYEFDLSDGRTLQLVWANQATASYTYSPVCQIADIRDAVGAPAAFDADANATPVDGEPRYVICAPRLEVTGTFWRSTAR